MLSELQAHSRPGRAGTRTRILAATAAVLVAGVLAAPVRADAAPSSVSAGQWSTAVCRALNRWDTELRKLNANHAPIPGSDLAAGRAAITKQLTGVLKAATRLGRDVRAAGVPAVKNGGAAAAAFATAVQSLQATYTKAVTDASALPTTDAPGFAAAARAIAAELRAAVPAPNGTLDRVTSVYAPALQQALASNKTCRSVL